MKRKQATSQRSSTARRGDAPLLLIVGVEGRGGRDQKPGLREGGVEGGGDEIRNPGFVRKRAEMAAGVNE